MTVRGFTHAQRRARLAQALADLKYGVPLQTVAANYNYSANSLRVMQSRARVPNARKAPRHHNPPKPRKPTNAERVGRRDAKLVELHSLGLTRHQIAAKLRVSGCTVYQSSTRLGLHFVHASARPTGIANRRAAQMAALYRAGYTLQQIGDQYSLTRERVRQLISKNFGITAEDGGKHVVGERNRLKREDARNQKCMRDKGCSWDEYQILKTTPKRPTYAFSQQRRNAHERGIGWELNLWQWWCIWRDSGHWSERGRGQGYVMCRKGDEGPYAVGNVYIATAAHNSWEGQRKRHRKHADLPMGVRPAKGNSGRYVAVRSVNGKQLRLGTFDTPALAYAAYLMASPVEARAA